jgi:hypothetical protein
MTAIAPRRTGAPRRLGRRVLVSAGAVVGWIVASWLLGGVAMLLGLLLLLLAFVLVPVGFVYGAVIRAVLLVRQRAAAASAAVQGGAPEGLPDTALRHADRWLAIVLLAIAVGLGLVWAVESVPVSSGSVPDGVAPLGILQSAAGQLAFGLITQALIAVVPAAALTTRIAMERGRLEREAVALGAGGADALRLRWTRALSWTAYGVWSVLALCCAVALVSSSMR